MNPSEEHPGAEGIRIAGFPLARVAVLAAIAVLAFGLRALEFDGVFAADGRVLLAPHDSALHARRALFTFVNFPSILFFDSYLAYPDGAVVPMPPLYDWLLGAIARLFGDSVEIFERVAAWCSPTLAVLTLFPIYAVGRAVGGPGLGLAAASIFAVLPISIVFSSVGSADHHAAVALVAACWLALSVSAVRRGLRGLRLVANAALRALVGAAMLLIWSGSILYIGLAEGALLLVGGLVAGRRDLLLAQSGAALAAVALVSPWVHAAGVPIGGPFASTTLSWLHPTLLGALSLLCGGLAALECARSSSGVGERCLRAAALGAIIALVALWALPIGDSLARGTEFIRGDDAWAAMNPEQRPLFSFLDSGPRAAWGSVHRPYGAFAYLIPVALLALVPRIREERTRLPALVLACWVAVLAVLAVQQVRFGNDFSVPGSVAFALLLVELRNWLFGRFSLRFATANVIALAAAALLLWPAFSIFHLPMLSRASGHLLSAPGRSESDPLSPKESLLRFAHTVRRLTPETSGYFDPDERPEYSILCPPTLGHTLLYAARRPTPAGNLGPYLDPEKFEAARLFFTVGSEAEALAIAESLGARYVLTAARRRFEPPRLDYRLHRLDGSASDGSDHLEHFRLVAEGPPNGQPLKIMFPRGLPTRSVPYKLFEIVEGALIEASGRPGGEMRAELDMETPVGRRFRFRAAARADSDGRVRLRVPYPSVSVSDSQIRPLGSYRVWLDGSWSSLAVSEKEVRQGRVVPLASSARGGSP